VTVAFHAEIGNEFDGRDGVLGEVMRGRGRH
jgi:hypothetical protein